MNRTVLVIGIIFLLIGASVVSSMKTVENEYRTKELLSRGKTAYAYIAYSGSSELPEGPCFFDLDDPGTLTSFAIENCPGFLCGAWTLDGKWLVCDENGSLWEIDLCYNTASEIGGGGTVFYGLTYNLVNEKLYGSTLDDLYEIDIDTGNPTYIGHFGISTYMIDIACDIDGVCYGWDVLFSGSSKLYTIDLDTGEATEYVCMGMCLSCVSSGSFDYETNTLYIAACSDSCGFLIKDGSIIGNFEGCAYLSSFVIPYPDDFCPPVTTYSLDPPDPDGENGWYVNDVTATLNATDGMSGVKETYYRINEEEWKAYQSPFDISEEGDDTLIEYYSVDNIGNAEVVKSATIDIDKTPPEMTVEWDVKKVYRLKWEVTFYINYTDNTSGMDRLYIFINDVLIETIYDPGPTYTWRSIIYGENTISFKFIGYDIAGNYAIVVVNNTDISTFNVIKDIFTYQSINPFILRILESFPLLQKLFLLIK